MYKHGIERNQVGPVGSAVTGMAALLVAWGCEPQPPEACGTVQDQTVNVRQVVRVTPCFTDPDGDALVLSAESSDPAVADVSVTQAAVSVRGAGVGGAAVVVTAKDHHGLQAQTRFGVAVPNRAPELTKAFDMLTAEIGSAQHVILGKHFTDPDGHAISYRIGSLDSSAVAAVVKNSALHLSGRAVGQTEVTVIASDAWSSAEGIVRVRVPEPVRSFRDDFDSEESLADWTGTRAGVSVEDGRLLDLPRLHGRLVVGVESSSRTRRDGAKRGPKACGLPASTPSGDPQVLGTRTVVVGRRCGGSPGWVQGHDERCRRCRAGWRRGGCPSIQAAWLSFSKLAGDS